MLDYSTIPGCRRSELLLSPPAYDGSCVLKDRGTGEYYRLGEEEVFLLEQLDGRQTVAAICAAHEARFEKQLTPDELKEFVGLARAQGLLDGRAETGIAPRPMATSAPPAASRPHSQQSILRWRFCLFDPDRLFTWLQPKIDFLWRVPFLLLSLASIVAAAVVVAANWEGLVSSFENALRWETAVVIWVALLAVTTLHEFAHGLTCKRYGGEVHEVGLLLLFLMPGLYCNVSDTWLFREKSKRLWVTLAGGYCDLVVWSLAVFVWRLTVQNSLLNYLAWVVLSVVGARVLLNLNPLLKLDGYYFLSDLVDVPNLQQRAFAYVMARLRWLLWGAERPALEPCGGLLLAYGLASGVFGLGFLGLMVLTLVQLLGDRWGPVGSVSVLVLGAVVLRGLLQGACEGEPWQMFLTRHRRTLAWGTVVGLGLAYALLGHKEDRATGGFQLRSAVRAEVRAPATAFLQEVCVEEGNLVAAGMVVARLSIPNLSTRIAQNKAEVREAEARLALLLAGARPEEVAAQRSRVARARNWLELARRDLGRALAAHEAELDQLSQQAAQARAELACAGDALERAERLRQAHAISEADYREAARRSQVAQAALEQAEAQGRARRALVCRQDEAELARRTRELAEAESALALLEVGARPEEIAAERARLARACEEGDFLRQLEAKLVVRCPQAGIVTTPRLAEKVGQYLHEGEVICLVEDPGALEAEVALADQEVARVKPGQPVTLKPRNLPRRTLQATIDRVAPRAVRQEKESSATVTVYCRLIAPPADLRPGTVGHARIGCGRRPIREILVDHSLRFLRTEVWW